MQSVQKLNSPIEKNDGYEQITIRVWRKTYTRLKSMQKNPEMSIVKLVDRGVALLEKQGNHEE